MNIDRLYAFFPPDFGASGNQFVEYAIRNMQDVSAVSAAVIDFCRLKGTDGKSPFGPEMVTRLSREVMAKYPDIPRKGIKGIRNPRLRGNHKRLPRLLPPG